MNALVEASWAPPRADKRPGPVHAQGTAVARSGSNSCQ